MATNIVESMSREHAGSRQWRHRLSFHVASIVAWLLVPAGAHAAWDWDFPAPVTPVAQQMLDLHSYILWACVVIFIQNVRTSATLRFPLQCGKREELVLASTVLMSMQLRT